MGMLNWRLGTIIAAVAVVVAIALAGFVKLGEMAARRDLAAAHKTLAKTSNELAQCQIDLSAAGHEIDSQNEKVELWIGEASKAQADAAKAKADAAKKARQYESRIAWLKSQQDTGEQCPGIEKMIDQYLISERKEVAP